jgi:DNA-binding CsgD family transcriptional regulator
MILAKAFVLPEWGAPRGGLLLEKKFQKDISLLGIIRAFRAEFSAINPRDITLVNTTTRKPDELTAKEREVIQALIEFECDSAAVASALFISVSTLVTHLASIREKTGCHSKAQIMAKYIKNPELFGGVEL